MAKNESKKKSKDKDNAFANADFRIDQSNNKDQSGFIIIKLNEEFSYFEGDLQTLCKKNKLTKLESLIEKFKPAAIRRNVQSASMEKLKELEQKAMNSKFPPLRSLSNYWRLDYRQFEGALEDLEKMFKSVREVENAYIESTVTDPFINATNDTFCAQQGYLDAAPTGIDARWAWTQIDRPGEGVGFIDLEQGWIPTHEDLTAASPSLIFNDNIDGVGGNIGDHGTAVLGEVVGSDNNRGVVGISPFVDYTRMASHFEAASGTNGHVADAIVAAILNMRAGDVLLLEVQRSFLPTETDAADFDAIRLATANGIIVVEAAGNGNNNLDTWTNGAGLRLLNRTDANFRDSGAIMIGASLSALPHNRASFSNFGSRLDCYAWGENVVTSGYANRNSGSLGNDGTATKNDDYTSSFGGTSSASPIVVGAALILQGLYKSNTGTLLSPGQMRSLLSNPATGTAQGGGVAGNIGIMPNLRAIIENSLQMVPDIYLRDYVGDTGAVPHTGAVSISPDIIVQPAMVADPTASFGEGSGTENNGTLGSRVEFGQDNFIYVRMKNRGPLAATGATATIYWSEVSTLVTPNMWHLIGTTTPINVPSGDTLAVTSALTWPSASLPPNNTHQCFVGILQHAFDAAPPIPSAFDWNGFVNFIKNHNNVTWRNFDVRDDILPNDPSAALFFNIANAPDKTRKFNFEILNQLPEGAEVYWEIPLPLYIALKHEIKDVKINKKKNSALLRLPSLRTQQFKNVALPKGAKFPCHFHVKGGKGYERGLHKIAIRQLFKNFEVGRVTFGLKTKDKDNK